MTQNLFGKPVNSYQSFHLACFQLEEVGNTLLKNLEWHGPTVPWRHASGYI